MRRHSCTGDIDTCRICANAADAAEWTPEASDDECEAAARDMVFGRWA